MPASSDHPGLAPKSPENHGLLRTGPVSRKIPGIRRLLFSIWALLGSAAILLAALPAQAQAQAPFPVRGAYSYGASGSLFGAPRPGGPHQGQDISAACGTPIVAVYGGEVIANDYHHRAGWHVVITNEQTNSSQAYIHLQGRSTLPLGARVAAGKFLGQVGNTGRSFACHLHFEFWRGPWQRSPGYPIDPLRLLQGLKFVD